MTKKSIAVLKSGSAAWPLPARIREIVCAA
jgi:hypothetical protein